MRKVPYPTPGEILLEEFLKPMAMTQYRLAKEIGVPQRRIGEIIAGKRSITADTGLRLSRFFGMSESFWIGLQLDYDREMAKQAMEKTLARIKPWKLRAAA
ncbi:MAG TPA: HigA family addiction module antitoxin [Nevskiaceae bacterium]|nr:HigA family addiction module antitoxin [Nevskiaceae bacterium]